MSATDGSVPWVQMSSKELGEFLCRPESKEVRPEIISEFRRRIVNEVKNGSRGQNGSALVAVLGLFGSLSEQIADLEARLTHLEEPPRVNPFGTRRRGVSHID